MQKIEKGYLLVKPIAAIQEELNRAERQNRPYEPGFASSMEGMGWIPLKAAIKQGNNLKVSAEILACVGKFVSVRKVHPYPYLTSSMNCYGADHRQVMAKAC